MSNEVKYLNPRPLRTLAATWDHSQRERALWPQEILSLCELCARQELTEEPRQLGPDMVGALWFKDLGEHCQIRFMFNWHDSETGLHLVLELISKDNTSYIPWPRNIVSGRVYTPSRLTKVAAENLVTVEIESIPQAPNAPSVRASQGGAS
jgi:hypothetical protein